MVEAFCKTLGPSFCFTPPLVEYDVLDGFLVGEYGSVCGRSKMVVIFLLHPVLGTLFWVCSFTISKCNP